MSPFEWQMGQLFISSAHPHPDSKTETARPANHTMRLCIVGTSEFTSQEPRVQTAPRACPNPSRDGKDHEERCGTREITERRLHIAIASVDSDTET